MRAAAIDKFGDPEVLKLQTLRVPIPDPSEVLIEVDTAAWDHGTLTFAVAGHPVAA